MRRIGGTPEWVRNAVCLTSVQNISTTEQVPTEPIQTMGSTKWLAATRKLRKLLSMGGLTFKDLMLAGFERELLRNELAWLEQNNLAKCESVVWTLTPAGFSSLDWVAIRQSEAKERNNTVETVAKKHGLSVHEMLCGPQFGPSVAARDELFATMHAAGVSTSAIAQRYGFSAERVGNAIERYRRKHG